jgi:hypothetical protein
MGLGISPAMAKAKYATKDLQDFIVASRKASAKFSVDHPNEKVADGEHRTYCTSFAPCEPPPPALLGTLAAHRRALP